MSVGRPRHVCEPCRARKIRCDKGTPCGPCLRRRIPSRCTGATGSEAASMPSPRPHSHSPERRREATADSAAADSPYPLSSIAESRGTLPIVFETHEPSGRESESSMVADMLDVFGMGLRTTRERLRRGAPAPPPMSAYLLEHMGRALAILPDEQRSRSLVDIYFAKVDWFTRALHRERYMSEFESLLASPHPQTVRPSWLCLHLGVICLATHMLDASERDALSIPDSECQDLAQTYFLASKELLFASDFYFNQTVEHLQCIILHGVYLYNTDEGADSHWALLGSAIKIAYNLGLNRLGPENVRDHQWPRPWQDPVQRDIGRRVWWNIVWNDWTLATGYCSTYCVHPSLNFTVLPGNHAAPTSAADHGVQPLDVYTPMSCFIFRRHYDTSQRETIDHRRENAFRDMAYVRRTDRRLETLGASLPPHFQSLSKAQQTAERLGSPTVVYEYLLLRIIHNARLVRLHVPYLVAGYTDPNYRYSADRVIGAAKATLQDLHMAWLECPALLNFWLVLSNSYFAAVVIFINLCYGPDTSKRQSQRNLLRQTVYVFREATGVSVIARNACRILDALLAAERDIAAAPLTAPDPGSELQPLRRAVERILGIGQHEAVPPAAATAVPSSSLSSSPAGEGSAPTTEDIWGEWLMPAADDWGGGGGDLSSLFPPADNASLERLLHLVGLDASFPGGST
ncbi:putative transcription factor lepB [Vanrija pseudolonga]|uniref:Transcription factor lepB n=1 Tax=Vanrija pseudolonga TaxID=143232 RepID=A0AAF0YG76_9TREE|nr:putative transcription factor lepB [Vanrija pseudolonga]